MSKVSQIITETVLKRMEEAEKNGEVFYWVKPFSEGSPNKPYSYDTGIPYRGINRILLDNDEFLTFAKVQEMNKKKDAVQYRIRKGAKASMVCYYNTIPVIDEETGVPQIDERTGEQITKGFWKYYRVFSRSDVVRADNGENLPSKFEFKHYSHEDATEQMTKALDRFNRLYEYFCEKYQNQLDTIKANNPYDDLEMSGSRAVWPEVLSVYAVKTTTDPDNPQEVASLTDEKKQLLTDIFWEMNDISYRTETDTETEIIESDDGNGNILEETVEVTKTTLYITVSHKTAEQMSDQYRFNDDQDSQLEELLNVDNSMWLAVLYGIYGSDDMIVQVALSQVGNVGGEPYWSWYGFGSRVEWCACFVSWCADQCGYIETGVCPKYAGCVNGVAWFKEHNQWVDGSETPSPGMIIFYDWDSPNGESGPQDGLSDHTGIVERVENGIVYTVEGNSGDSCRQCHRAVGNYEILGYGVLIP